ncbi:MAG: D-alanyl-D-alanine carboxypeptidase, partial [Bacteroidales bacterium]|nr:D-alanyl-D-alanine carboxypeptidase [Bacteroidales bacterium]
VGAGQSWSEDFVASIPGPGDGGTLGSLFSDPLFAGRLKAKSGSMTRVRNYAGYITTLSGRRLAFCILINNFTGQGSVIATHCEAILKETVGGM